MDNKNVSIKELCTVEGCRKRCASSRLCREHLEKRN
jgi:hypothetical protein